MQPQRVLLTRDGSDADHDAMRDVPGILPAEPSVGDPMQVWTEDGKLMRTSKVRRIDRAGSQLVVETMNSRYRLKLTPITAASA